MELFVSMELIVYQHGSETYLNGQVNHINPEFKSPTDFGKNLQNNFFEIIFPLLLNINIYRISS